MLPPYMDALRRENIGTTVVWCSKDGLSANISHGSSTRSVLNQGLPELCSLISIDKTQIICKYRGAMLVAFRVYVNDQLFQLAFAIIEGEKNDNWDRFMACIRARVMQRPDLCVISDRHKDIIMVMNNEHLGSHPGHASHHFCVQYLASYFHSRFHDKSLKMLTVWATYEQQPTILVWNGALGSNLDARAWLRAIPEISGLYVTKALCKVFERWPIY